VRRRTEAISRLVVCWLSKPTAKPAATLASICPDGLKTGLGPRSACCRIAVRAPRKLHTAAAIPSAVLRPNPAVLGRKGRVGRSGLAHGPLDAPGERQHDKDGADTQEGRRWGQEA